MRPDGFRTCSTRGQINTYILKRTRFRLGELLPRVKWRIADNKLALVPVAKFNVFIIFFFYNSLHQLFVSNNVFRILTKYFIGNVLFECFTKIITRIMLAIWNGYVIIYYLGYQSRCLISNKYNTIRFGVNKYTRVISMCSTSRVEQLLIIMYSSRST